MTKPRQIGMDASANGPPPTEAACLYEGQVMHQRLKPFGHRFTYRVFSLMVDLDRLKEAHGLSRFFSVNRFNWLSFKEKDHLDAGEQDLAVTARRRFREAGMSQDIARVRLVCYPRIFGIVFNPLAVYYAYDEREDLLGLIYEVRNTFGGRHRYVLKLEDGEAGRNGIRQTTAKEFHVSPFLDMDMRYHFRMLPPGQDIRWRILETDSEGPLLSAVFSGTRRALHSVEIMKLCARIPLLPVTILGGIHWEALKLWLKGAKFHSDPAKAVTTPVSPQLPQPRFDANVEQKASLAR